MIRPANIYGSFEAAFCLNKMKNSNVWWNDRKYSKIRLINEAWNK